MVFPYALLVLCFGMILRCPEGSRVPCGSNISKKTGELSWQNNAQAVTCTWGITVPRIYTLFIKVKGLVVKNKQFTNCRNYFQIADILEKKAKAVLSKSCESKRQLSVQSRSNRVAISINTDSTEAFKFKLRWSGGPLAKFFDTVKENAVTIVVALCVFLSNILVTLAIVKIYKNRRKIQNITKSDEYEMCDISAGRSVGRNFNESEASTTGNENQYEEIRADIFADQNKKNPNARASPAMMNKVDRNQTRPGSDYLLVCSGESI